MERRTDEKNIGHMTTRDFKHGQFIQPRIVIIGAGAAGLSAAQHLIENGFNNFIILEALDRVGGRVWTVSTENGHAEMGAQFLHGKDLFYDVADKNKMIRDVSAYSGKLVNPVIELGSGGEFLVDEDLEMTPPYLHKVFDETYLAIGGIVEDCKYAQSHLSSDRSLGCYMQEQFEIFLQQYQNDTEEVRNYRRSIFDWMDRSHCVDNACVSLSDVSILEYAKYSGGLINLPLIVPMSTALGLCVPDVRKVQLCTPVKQIKFRRDLIHPIQVICENGNIFQADHCIVTSSLGFLKKNAGRFFKPTLSAEKISAIKEAGFGTVDKIFLRFSDPFWEEKFGPGVEGFQLLFMEKTDIGEKKPWYEAIIGFDVSRTLPNTLVGWVAGKEAEQMESIGDEEVSSICHALLKKFIKGVNVPKPIQIMRPNWFSNPFICGSYSYAAADQAKHIDMLSQPTWFYKSKSRKLLEIPGLLFAGEATHPTLFSTIPGALESGQREANRIIVLYTKS